MPLSMVGMFCKTGVTMLFTFCSKCLVYLNEVSWFSKVSSNQFKHGK